MARTVAGICYGAVLVGLSILAAGAGHGSYIPALISSAPFGFLPFWAAPFAGAPLLWGGLAALLRWRMPDGRRVVPGLLLVHYASAIALSLSPPFGEDWRYVARSMPAIGGIIALWAGIYVIGQFVIWRAAMRHASHGRSRF